MSTPTTSADVTRSGKGRAGRGPLRIELPFLRSRWTRLAMIVVGIVLAYALPIVRPPFLTTPDSDFGGVMVTCASYALVAVGLNIVIGYAGLLDLGYVGFYATGAYTTGVLTSQHAHWPFFLTLPVAIAVTMVSGVILGGPAIRVRGDYLAIVTLGFGEIITIVARNSNWLGSASGIKDIPPPSSIGPNPIGTDQDGVFQIPHLTWNGLVPSVDNLHKTPFLTFDVLDAIPYYWLLLTVIIIVLIADVLIKDSRVGRAWEATREDEDAAELMGVPTFRYKLLAFAMGAAIGGLAGSMLAAGQGGFISPDAFPLQLSMLFVAAVLIGGAGNRWGALVGGLLVAYLPERFRGLSDWRLLIFGVSLMVIVTFRPQGILPPRRTRRALRVQAEIEELQKGTPSMSESDPTTDPTTGTSTGTSTGTAPDTRKALLEVDDVTIRFGGVVALDAVSFDIKQGEILGLIGPNGAGKTTCFNVMTGVYQATSGQIRFDGQPLEKMKRHSITKLGIARTFQNIRLFKAMTALENVLVGADANSNVGLLNALFRTPRHRRIESASVEEAYRLLEFVGVGGRADELAENLSYGDQRRLEIARAIATKPKLLCLDEPAAGFNPAEKQRLMDLIRKVRDEGYTVLLIEHDMRLVMGVTDRIVVLEFGRKIAEGRPDEIRDNPAVIAAYLGVDEEDAS